MFCNPLSLPSGPTGGADRGLGDEGKWVIVIPGRAARGGSAPGEPLEDRELSNCRSTGGCWSAGEREGEEQQEKEGGGDLCLLFRTQKGLIGYECQ